MQRNCHPFRMEFLSSVAARKLDTMTSITGMNLLSGRRLKLGFFIFNLHKF